jgi:hypothetical protein
VGGVRDVQVISRLVEDRIEHATGEPVDAALASALAASLYAEPKRVPRLAGRRRRFGGIVWRLALHTGPLAMRALESAERLDGAAQAELWANREQHRPAGNAAPLLTLRSYRTTG